MRAKNAGQTKAQKCRDQLCFSFMNKWLCPPDCRGQGIQTMLLDVNEPSSLITGTKEFQLTYGGGLQSNRMPERCLLGEVMCFKIFILTGHDHLLVDLSILLAPTARWHYMHTFASISHHMKVIIIFSLKLSVFFFLSYSIFNNHIWLPLFIFLFKKFTKLWVLIWDALRTIL